MGQAWSVGVGNEPRATGSRAQRTFRLKLRSSLDPASHPASDPCMAPVVSQGSGTCSCLIARAAFLSAFPSFPKSLAASFFPAASFLGASFFGSGAGAAAPFFFLSFLALGCQRGKKVSPALARLGLPFLCHLQRVTIRELLLEREQGRHLECHSSSELDAAWDGGGGIRVQGQTKARSGGSWFDWG
jgi:hypothetical protein